MIIFPYAAFLTANSGCGVKRRRNPKLPEANPASRSSAKAKSRREKSSPYDAGNQALLAALADVTSGLRMGGDAVSPATAWLPSAAISRSLPARLLPRRHRRMSVTLRRGSDGHSSDQRRSSGPVCGCVDREVLGPGNHRQPGSGFLGQSDAFCRFAGCATAISARPGSCGGFLSCAMESGGLRRGRCCAPFHSGAGNAACLPRVDHDRRPGRQQHPHSAYSISSSVR